VKCPFCGDAENKVVDSRLSKEGAVIRRRRACEACSRRFTTYERVEELTPLVVKKDGRREQFDRQKLVAGLKRACEKRVIPSDTIEGLADEVERSLTERGDKEVESREIGDLVMARLREIDEVAYVRFASVYRSFRDVDEFMDELKRLVANRERD
jgi:transcriptional repressor NrdR